MLRGLGAESPRPLDADEPAGADGLVLLADGPCALADGGWRPDYARVSCNLFNLPHGAHCFVILKMYPAVSRVL